MNLLEGKSGLIIGASSTIGQAVARAAVQHGAKVMLTYHVNEQAIHSLLDEGGFDQCAICPCDIAKRDLIEFAITAAAEHFTSNLRRSKALDFIVLAVASAHPRGLAAKLSDVREEWFDFTMQHGAYPIIPVCKYGAKAMQPSGAIVTFGYRGGSQVMPGYDLMGIAKAGQTQAVRSLANELGPKNIRVNEVVAGAFESPSGKYVKGFSTLYDALPNQLPLRSHVSLTAIAQMAVVLVSDISSAVTGASIPVDNGEHLMTTLNLA